MEHDIDPEAIRLRAHELSELHPNATAEDNWLLAEAELAAAAAKSAREAAEAAADFMANVELNVYGHS